MNGATQISKYFVYSEIVRTEQRRFIDQNHPSPEELLRIKALLCHVLDPIREAHGRPLVTHSVFRSLALNRAIGSSDSSQHPKGEAADFHVSGVSLFAVARWITVNLEWDQLILEYVNPSGSSGWLHCSYTDTRPNREQILWKDATRNYEPITRLDIPKV